MRLLHRSLNGEAMRSCTTPSSKAAGKHVTTLEGLSADGTHPVQVAWQDLDVPQCGYCQAGQMMSASALLAKNPHPTDADIDSAMDGNICRCGTYLRIRKAIHKAAEIAAKQPAKSPLLPSIHNALGEECVRRFYGNDTCQPSLISSRLCNRRWRHAAGLLRRAD